MATAIENDTTKHLTIQFEDAGSGWLLARVREVPEAIGQGRTRDEAYANVLDALHDLTHEPSVIERVAYWCQARVVDPLGEFLRR
jgi:hypothetical protein